MLTKNIIALYLITGLSAIDSGDCIQSQTAIVPNSTSKNKSQNPESTKILCEVSIA